MSCKKRNWNEASKNEFFFTSTHPQAGEQAWNLLRGKGDHAAGNCEVGGVGKNEVRQVGCTQLQMPVTLRW